MEQMAYQLRKFSIQVSPGQWEECEVVVAEGTGLGYWWPEGEESCLLQHFASGCSLRVWALSEEAAQECIEAVRGLVDWTLPKEELFRACDQETLHFRFFGEVERLVNEGCALEY